MLTGFATNLDPTFATFPFSRDCNQTKDSLIKSCLIHRGVLFTSCVVYSVFNFVNTFFFLFDVLFLLFLRCDGMTHDCNVTVNIYLAVGGQPAFFHFASSSPSALSIVLALDVQCALHTRIPMYIYICSSFTLLFHTVLARRTNCLCVAYSGIEQSRAVNASFHKFINMHLRVLYRRRLPASIHKSVECGSVYVKMQTPQ